MINNINKYPQFTEESEPKLIHPILFANIFESWTVNRLLAYYPSAKDFEKSEVITRIVEELWSKEKLFNAFKAIDFFLATSGKRGHFVHQFEVYLLGLNFLLMFKNKRENLHDDFGFAEFSQVLFAWQVTALTHDFGYPVEDGHKILKKLKELYQEFDLQYLSDRLVSAEEIEISKKDHDITKIHLEKAPEELVGNYLDIRSVVLRSLARSLKVTTAKAAEIMDTFSKNNKHGYISSLMATRMLLRDILNEVGPEGVTEHPKFKAIEKAAGAIALHSLSVSKPTEVEIIGLISYDANPLAFLLFVIDNIQDWNRTVFRDDDYPDYKLSSFHTSNDLIDIQYSIVHEEWSEDVRKKAETFVTEKATLLTVIQKPNPPLNVTLKISFTRSDGFSYDPITVVF